MEPATATQADENEHINPFKAFLVFIRMARYTVLKPPNQQREKGRNSCFWYSYLRALDLGRDRADDVHHAWCYRFTFTAPILYTGIQHFSESDTPTQIHDGSKGCSYFKILSTSTAFNVTPQRVDRAVDSSATVTDSSHPYRALQSRKCGK